MADGFPVAVTCRMLNISRSGYYEWRDRPPSTSETADGELTAVIERIHRESRGIYGAPPGARRAAPGADRHVGRMRVGRLMGLAGIPGISHRRKVGKPRPLLAPHDDLLERQFTTDRPDRLSFTDSVEHPS